MVAQRAGEVLGQLTLVEVAADLADIALLRLGSRIFLGLDVRMVICVGAGLIPGQNLCLDNICDVEHLRFDILDIDDLAGQNGVGVLGNVANAVCGALVVFAVGKLIDIAAGLEAEVLEQTVRRFFGEDGNVELAGLHDHVAGVVFLDNGDGYLLRVAGSDLTCGVYDAAVVNSVNSGGEHLNTVVELGEYRIVNGKGVACFGSLEYPYRGLNVRSNSVGKSVKLGKLGIGNVGLERNGLADKLRALQTGESILHETAGRCCPRTVFQDCHLAVLQIVVCNIVHEIFHSDENAGVVGRGSKNHVAVFERVGKYVGGRSDGGVIHLGLYPALCQLAGEDVDGVFGVSVNGGIGYHNAVLLGGVGAPLEILLKEIAEVAAPYKAVQGADIVKLKGGCLFQHCLNLCAVLADDVGVVAAGLIEVVGEEIDLIVKQVAVECTEGAEGVCREENFVGQVVGHHDLRPMHHGSHYKGEIMLAGGKSVALFDNEVLELIGKTEELTEHGLNLAVANDGNIGITQNKLIDSRSVVRFHVGNHKVVELSSAESMGNIFKECAAHRFVNGVKKHGLVVNEQV